MSGEQRDRTIVQKIIQYCDEAAEIVKECGDSKEGFLANRTGRYATAMCLMQIGELTGHLSDEAKAKMSVISWNMIRGMRNILAHDYVSVDWNVIWATTAKDLPVLRLVCHGYLEN